MRVLHRNKRPIYYAVYEGKEEIVKDGLYTGSYKKLYGDVAVQKMDVGASRTAYGFVSSVVTMEYHGLDKPYSKVALTDNMNCPITEESVIWLDMGNLSEYSDASTYSVGNKVIHEGRIYECNQAVNSPSEFDSESWSLVPHNYIVSGMAKSLNFIAYMLKEVDFREDNN